jgi:hypothetical protein
VVVDFNALEDLALEPGECSAQHWNPNGNHELRCAFSFASPAEKGGILSLRVMQDADAEVMAFGYELMRSTRFQGNHYRGRVEAYRSKAVDCHAVHVAGTFLLDGNHGDTGCKQGDCFPELGTTVQLNGVSERFSVAHSIHRMGATCADAT